TTNTKMAEAKTLSFCGFTSPRVPAVKYKVVLTKGKDTYEHIIETKYDETAITTLAERKKQEEMTQIMFNMVEDLAYMVYEITTMQKKAQEIIDADGKGKKEAQKLYDALEDFRTDLVVTTGDNYVASAEPELRERMGDLYANIAGSNDRVSGAQMQNYELIKEEFEEEKERFEAIKSKEGKKFMKVLEKNDMQLTIKSKEEFLSDD
ncbi:MAG: hypothetical protein R3359_10200, partial [Marinirhabdus sp.]|nr:hypothetical protein [Marinirhabdus sp.]